MLAPLMLPLPLLQSPLSISTIFTQQLPRDTRPQVATAEEEGTAGAAKKVTGKPCFNPCLGFPIRASNGIFLWLLLQHAADLITSTISFVRGLRLCLSINANFRSRSAVKVSLHPLFYAPHRQPIADSLFTSGRPPPDLTWAPGTVDQYPIYRTCPMLNERE